MLLIQLKISLSDNVSDTIESLSPPMDQIPSSCQTSTHLPKDDNRSLQVSSRTNMPRKQETTPTLDENMEVIKNSIQQATLIFHILSNNEKSLLLEAYPDLRTQVGDLGAVMESLFHGNSGSGTHQHVPSETSDYNPSETGHHSPTRSPIKTKSKKSKAQQVHGHSRLRTSQNSNSEELDMEGKTLSFEEFLKICHPDVAMSLCDPENHGKPISKPATHLQAAWLFCNGIIQPNLCAKLLKFANKISQSNKNEISTSAADGLSESKSSAEPVTSQEEHDRIKAIKNFMDNFQEYETRGNERSLYIKIWDKVSLADLIELDWEAYLRRDTKGTRNHVRWAYDIWTKDWTRTVRKNKWSKMENVVAQSWAEKLVEGRYWRQWCSFLSGGSDVHHRGALLLLLVGILEPEDKLNEPALKLARLYIQNTLPWVHELVAILNPWALRMYQDALEKQELEEFENSLCEFKRETSKDGL
jgi:hypothetical protein